ncbi:hypothetical protein O3M35_001423 [Rhynocoris fuscipes]|uniref:Uncharacterized protein n=1 Tax=Rhynocoris fuscipes TaxID=488301 RepID=A0AAW1CNW5_9HEMI
MLKKLIKVNVNILSKYASKTNKPVDDVMKDLKLKTEEAKKNVTPKAQELATILKQHQEALMQVLDQNKKYIDEQIKKTADLKTAVDNITKKFIGQSAKISKDYKLGDENAENLKKMLAQTVTELSSELNKAYDKFRISSSLQIDTIKKSVPTFTPDEELLKKIRNKLDEAKKTIHPKSEELMKMIHQHQETFLKTVAEKRKLIDEQIKKSPKLKKAFEDVTVKFTEQSAKILKDQKLTENLENLKKMLAQIVSELSKEMRKTYKKFKDSSDKNV